MSSEQFAIQVNAVSKCYHMYNRPQDRLKQSLIPPLQSMVGMRRSQYMREFWALRDVSFSVRRGESVGILGRNGSGKSTLLQLICGTLTPTSGSVEVFGRIAALLELGSGFNPEFSGRENVFLNLALQGFSRAETEERFESVAGFADIGEFIEQPVKTYSSGMYARLAFAAAIHTEPEILIVDEILAVGDAPFQQKCMKRLYSMLDDGVSILMVSHDAYQIRSICHKALLLENGNQRLFDSSDVVLDEYVASSGRTDSELPEDRCTGVGAEASAEQDHTGFSMVIRHPTLISGDTRHIGELQSNDPLQVEFEYELLGAYQDGLSFVVNLYREDDVYIFGTTTGMRGLSAFEPSARGLVTVAFPRMPLVSGKYKFRVAVNDARGMAILAEAAPVCHFTVVDDFTAVGLIDLDHSWTRQILPPR